MLWTVAPWEARMWAVARPMPEEPPVAVCELLAIFHIYI